MLKKNKNIKEIKKIIKKIANNKDKTMKTIKILLISIIAFTSLNSYAIVPVKAITETVELAAKQSGKFLSPAMKKVAIESLEKNVLKYGTKVITFTEKGGLEAIKATTKYGDDFLELCAKNPQAVKSLALNADTYIPLAKRYGDDFLKLEAKAVGITKNITKTYDDDALKLLANKNPDDVSKLLGTAKTCDSPEAKALLLKNFSTSKNPTLFIERLSPKQIIAMGVPLGAGGLSVAAITAAYQVSDGVQEGLVEVSKSSPETFAKVTSNIFSSLVYIGLIIIILIAIAALVVFKGPIFVLKKIGAGIYATLRGIKNLTLKIFSSKKKEESKDKDIKEEKEKPSS